MELSFTQTYQYKISDKHADQSVSEQLLLLDCIFHTDMGHSGYDVELAVRKSFTISLQMMPSANRNTILAMWLLSKLQSVGSNQELVEQGAVLQAMREMTDWIAAYELMPEELEIDFI